MNADKEKLYELLEDIKKIIEQNETEDGNFRFPRHIRTCGTAAPQPCDV